MKTLIEVFTPTTVIIDGQMKPAIMFLEPNGAGKTIYFRDIDTKTQGCYY